MAPGKASSDSAELLSRGGSSPRRAGSRELLVVAAIAVAHVSATLSAKAVVGAFSPFFMMWFSTSWHMALFAPLVARSPGWRAALPSGAAALGALPFYLLFAGANVLYVMALGNLEASLVMAVFSVTPALVALLSVVVLGRRLTPLACGAVGVAACGVVLIAQPWRHGEGGAGGGEGGAGGGEGGGAGGGEGGGAGVGGAPTPLAIGLVLGASGCAASYKVFFRRAFGDAPALAVTRVLALIGVFSLTLGSILLYALEGGGVFDFEGREPTWMWLGLLSKSAFDLGFNFFIAWGISLIHPLFISIGTLLSSPLSVLVGLVLTGAAPPPSAIGGMLAIALAFGLILLDEHRAVGSTDRAAPAAPASSSEPVERRATRSRDAEAAAEIGGIQLRRSD